MLISILFAKNNVCSSFSLVQSFPFPFFVCNIKLHAKTILMMPSSSCFNTAKCLLIKNVKK